MRKSLIALSAAFALAAIAPAAAAEVAPQSSTFTHEGVTYTYTKTQVGKSMIYEGYARPGQKFRLVRNSDQVVGTVNGVSVSFRMKDVRMPASSITLASR